MLELRAFACNERGESAIALKLLLACAEGPAPSLEMWNNVAWTISKLGGGVPVARALPILERALTFAPSNREIFVNVATAATVLGLRDLALDAVEGAVKHRVDRIEALRDAPLLRPIAGDPRFRAAFAVTTPGIDLRHLESLVTVLPINGKRRTVHRAVAGMTFYLTGSLQQICPRIGKLLDAYRVDVPAGSLDYGGRSGWKKLTKAMMTRTRAKLDAIPDEYEYVSLQLRPGDGEAAEHGFEARADASDGGGTVTLAFPLGALRDPDAFHARFLRYAELVHCESAHAGLDVMNSESDDDDGEWNRLELAKRFLGCQDALDTWRPGQAPPAHWLVWLDAKLVVALTTRGPLALGEAKLDRSPARLVIRAAHHVPICPVDAPDDRGALPDIARALRPLRVAIKNKEAAARLARWDKLPSAAYQG